MSTAEPNNSRAGALHKLRSVRPPCGDCALSAGFAIALLSLAASALPAAAQTLTQALAETYNTNPQLLAQRAQLRATDEQVPQALSGWRPTVNFTGQMGGARSSFTTGSALTGGRVSMYSTFFQ